jgi:DNA-binding NtrC family response regulator
MNKNKAIFIMDDDYDYGRLVLAKLSREKFTNVHLYTEEDECLRDMVKKPVLMIIDYHLGHMTGLQFIQKAKEIYPNFTAFLVSGEFHKDFYKINDDRFIRYVDKYFIKGMDELNELVDTVDSVVGQQ